MGTYKSLIDFFYKKTKIDLSLYKEGQMKRRIETFIQQEIGSVDYNKFIDKLSKDKDLLDRFKERITINVTEFFRNPGVWANIENNVIPKLIKDSNSNKLTIWSAGCSSGEEPYSLAMLLSEKFPKVKWKIIASDLDATVLEKCKSGQYGKSQISTLDGVFKDKYFTQVKDSEVKNPDWFMLNEPVFQIDSKLRRNIEFRQHNLLQDQFPKDVDLILCRNVVIYFTEETKAELYINFCKSLRQGGVLVIGSTEQIINHKEKGYEKMADWTFVKK